MELMLEQQESSESAAPINGEQLSENMIDEEPQQEITWAQRIAASKLAQVQEAHASQNGEVVAESREVPVKAPSILDYLLHLANQCSEQGECPVEWAKYKDCLAEGLPNLRPVSYHRLGLRNEANICYVNVIVQALLSCTALMQLLRQCSRADEDRPFYSGMNCICREFHRTREHEATFVNPLMLPPVQHIVASWQKLGVQQDAAEFLMYLLNGMHEECKWTPAENNVEPEKSEPENGDDSPVESHWAELVKNNQRRRDCRLAGLQEDSPIMRIFGGMLQSIVRVKGSAKADSASQEPFNVLALDITPPGVTSVWQALEGFCNQEDLMVSEGQATRKVQFTMLPKVLVLCLKRFTFDKVKKKPEKVKKMVKYEPKLVLDKKWLSEKISSSPEYVSTAVITHHGESVNSGHYRALVRYNSEWYMYDDAVVQKVENLKEVGSYKDTAYLLVYQHVGTVNILP
mmetsp:Transcript_55794/g.103235  ORF Transcript_55794/g.103235 Transcript_55794/m.103235 type:complete len:460 (-) Transcript_55794:121-1500(-)